MSYIRISSPPLSLDQKKTLVKDLTEVSVRQLNLTPDQKQQVTVHFAPFNLDDLAMGGTLLQDSKQPVLHVEVLSPQINQQQKEKLATEFTSIIAKDLNLGPDQIKQVGIHFLAFDAQNMFMGGKAMQQTERR